jgi:hypothetical protein
LGSRRISTVALESSCARAHEFFAPEEYDAGASLQPSMQQLASQLVFTSAFKEGEAQPSHCSNFEFELTTFNVCKVVRPTTMCNSQASVNRSPLMVVR